VRIGKTISSYNNYRTNVLFLARVESKRISDPNSYEKVGLALVCPNTSQVKVYPFEVILPDGLSIGGAILADQAGREIQRIASGNNARIPAKNGSEFYK
jgi:hypothetical protein